MRRGKSLPFLLQALSEQIGEAIDLGESLHVGKRTAQRYDVAVDIWTKVASPDSKTLALNWASFQVALQTFALSSFSNVRITNAPLSEDLLALTGIHSPMIAGNNDG